MTNKLWGGRFKKKIDPLFERFSASFKWDVRLLPFDLAIDAAHVKALRRCGILTGSEEKKLLSAIHELWAKAEKGSLKLRRDAEDVHSAVQEELKKSVGPLADKIHTGRSRNDLVSQSSRLYCKAHASTVLALISDLQRAVVRKAAESEAVLIPGMTHLQNAQVLSQAHVFLAYAEMLERSKAHFKLARELADVCVLGSGALAGVTFKLDQSLIARELGLSKVTANSYDVSGDRDFVLSFLSATAFLGTQLSRIAEDFMIAQTRPFSVIDIDEAFCTGSSIMPQKKNADFIELARGFAGVATGHLAGFLTTLKGLPTSYNRDLQWDKRSLFESAEAGEELLTIFKGVFDTLQVRAERAEELLKDESLYATDLADYLVQKGAAFKTAHEQVGRIVSFAEENGLPISKIGLDILKSFAPQAGGDIYDLFDARHSVEMKKTVGSTKPAEVKKQIKNWQQKLK